MPISDFLRDAARDGRLVSAHPEVDEAGDARAPGAFAGFFRLPIYRCYLHGLESESLPMPRLSGLAPLSELHLVRTPAPRGRRGHIVAFHHTDPLGILPHEDGLLVDKFERRALPLFARLIGVQLMEPPDRRLAVEIGLLYPPHPTTDEALEVQDRNRRDGLRKLGDRANRPPRLTRDPLSAGHVFEEYYFEE